MPGRRVATTNRRCPRRTANASHAALTSPARWTPSTTSTTGRPPAARVMTASSAVNSLAWWAWGSGRAVSPVSEPSPRSDPSSGPSRSRSSPRHAATSSTGRRPRRQPGRCLVDARLQLRHVEPIARQCVAGLTSGQAVSAKDAPQSGDQHADLVVGTGRRLDGPDDVDQPIDRHRPSPGQCQGLQQRARLAGADLMGREALDLQPAQHPNASVTHGVDAMANGRPRAPRAPRPRPPRARDALPTPRSTRPAPRRSPAG